MPVESSSFSEGFPINFLFSAENFKCSLAKYPQNDLLLMVLARENFAPEEMIFAWKVTDHKTSIDKFE